MPSVSSHKPRSIFYYRVGVRKCQNFTFSFYFKISVLKCCTTSGAQAANNINYIIHIYRWLIKNLFNPFTTKLQFNFTIHTHVINITVYFTGLLFGCKVCQILSRKSAVCCLPRRRELERRTLAFIFTIKAFAMLQQYFYPVFL